MRAATAHIRSTCPIFAAHIKRTGPCKLRHEQDKDLYQALVSAIAYQQLHGNAARAILGRFAALYPDAPFPTPQQVLSTDDATMRACGFSGAKTASIRDIAAKTVEGVVPSRRTATRLSDAELIERLTVIRGVGRWTVEMLLMFTLGRKDILPVDDFGVRDGYRVLYALEAQPKPREMAALGEVWSPYRSVATWYLWRAADAGKTVKQPG